MQIIEGALSAIEFCIFQAHLLAKSYFRATMCTRSVLQQAVGCSKALRAVTYLARTYDREDGDRGFSLHGGYIQNIFYIRFY